MIMKMMIYKRDADQHKLKAHKAKQKSREKQIGYYKWESSKGGDILIIAEEQLGGAVRKASNS